MQTPLEAFLSKHYAEGPFYVETTLKANGERELFLVRGENDCFVAKVSEPGRDEARVQQEAALVEDLSVRGLPVPRPVLSLDGQMVLPFQDRFLYVYEYIDGRHPEPGDALYAQLGTLLARLHSLPVTPEMQPTDYRPVDWLPKVEVYLRAAGLAENDPEKKSALVEMITMIEQFPSFEGLPEGLIHTDPYLVNMLLTERRGLYLIDWDDSGVSYPLLDVGYVLAHLCTFSARDRAIWNVPGPESGPSRRADWADAFLAAYQLVRPLTEQEQALLPWAVRFAFLVYIPDWESKTSVIWDNYERLKLLENAG